MKCLRSSRAYWVPERFFEPLEGGPLKGNKLSKDEFKRAIATYYQMMDWNDNGVPTEMKLAELDIDWVAEELKNRFSRARNKLQVWICLKGYLLERSQLR
ncbi:MAG TPA: hypothetical protein EYP19_13330 [Desulfobacterales bacterium]|nr:hypothetical protein [Desulfobacterales bacterium]